MLISASLTACGHDKAAQLGGAYTDKAKAEAATIARHEADRLIMQARRMPELPGECRREHFSGTTANDTYKTSAKKGDNALYEANRQIRGCAGWYDATRAAREPAAKKDQ